MSKKKGPQSKARNKTRRRPATARAVVTPPLKKRRSPLPAPAGNVSDEVMERLWREEREGR